MRYVPASPGRASARAALLLAALLTPSVAALAQQTTGTITGRIVDADDRPVPGVLVTASHDATGLTRSDITSGEGRFRISALPVGIYDLKIQIEGFKTLERANIPVAVAAAVDVPVRLEAGALGEEVLVTAGAPLVSLSDASLGGLVDLDLIENLPLNGRQFANAALTIPGVGLGYHSDPTKSTQFSPQISGGNGRNINYQIDGGDNNDDTVGGLLQLFPLEAVEQFNFMTQRYKAEYGRSNAGVMAIVTRSGTNSTRGSWFTLFRDESLNALTETQIQAARGAGEEPVKPDYRRWQHGGSIGGPIRVDRAHYFVALERTRQDTFQTVDTRGVSPDEDGVFMTSYLENLMTGKVTFDAGATHYLALRYGRNTNSQPGGVSPRVPPSGWNQSTNTFNSLNFNHNWVLGDSRLNEFVAQYSDFTNDLTANSYGPRIWLPNGVVLGQNWDAPQQTEQRKYQLRDDFSWTVDGLGGLGHDFKVGANLVVEPRLYFTFGGSDEDYTYLLLTTDLAGPVGEVFRYGGPAAGNTPMWQLGAYVQDDWHVTSRLTLNLGLRYDYHDGYAIDQSRNPDFVTLQAAALAGRFEGQRAFRDFGKTPREDTNNWQPRLGFVWDLSGRGRTVVRGGYGRYYDVGYSAATTLEANINGSGVGTGAVFVVWDPSGIRKSDGTLFRVGDPIETIAAQNEITDPNPMMASIASPRIRQPFTDQVSIGWSHQIGAATVVDVDYVESRGRDLAWTASPNLRDGPGLPRQFSDLSLSASNFMLVISDGESRYRGLNVGLRRRAVDGLSYSAWYTLSDAVSNLGPGLDETHFPTTQDHRDPYDAVNTGPSTRTGARHRVTISAVWHGPWGLAISPVYRFRSALPVFLLDGRDLNGNGYASDIPATAYAFDGRDRDGNPRVREIGPCKTVNCGRGAAESAFNLRISKRFDLFRSVRLEAIAEIFNLFNAKNPDAFVDRVVVPTTGERNPDLLRPTRYSGDSMRPEQRIGQIGFRFTF